MKKIARRLRTWRARPEKPPIKWSTKPLSASRWPAMRMSRKSSHDGERLCSVSKECGNIVMTFPTLPSCGNRGIGMYRQADLPADGVSDDGAETAARYRRRDRLQQRPAAGRGILRHYDGSSCDLGGYRC